MLTARRPDAGKAPQEESPAPGLFRECMDKADDDQLIGMRQRQCIVSSRTELSKLVATASSVKTLHGRPSNGRNFLLFPICADLLPTVHKTQKHPVARIRAFSSGWSTHGEMHKNKLSDTRDSDRQSRRSHRHSHRGQSQSQSTQSNGNGYEL